MFISIRKILELSTRRVKQTANRLTEMLKALVIYHSEMDETKLLAEKIARRLEDLGIQVAISQDKQFKDFESIRNCDIIALGAPCLACRKCHGAEECRAPKLLRRHIKKLFKMNLRGRKLITFANSADPRNMSGFEKELKPSWHQPRSTWSHPSATPANTRKT